MDEPVIEINGVLLTPSQSMSLRVACSSMLMDMRSDPCVLGKDTHGRTMTAIYEANLAEIEQLMVGVK